MSFGARLTHTVSIVHRADSGSLDDYGQPTMTETAHGAKAAIQPRRASEVAAISQAGVALSDHVIFLFPTDITVADYVLHDQLTCQMHPDFPTSRFEVVGVPNAAGLGHHLEVAAKLIQTAAEAEGS